MQKLRNFEKSKLEKRNDQIFFDNIRNIDNEKCFFPRGYEDITD